MKNHHYSISGGEVKVWLEQEAVHIKAVSGNSDPAELTKKQALELASAIKQLTDLIKD